MNVVEDILIEAPSSDLFLFSAKVKSRPFVFSSKSLIIFYVAGFNCKALFKILCNIDLLAIVLLLCIEQKGNYEIFRRCIMM